MVNQKTLRIRSYCAKTTDFNEAERFYLSIRESERAKYFVGKTSNGTYYLCHSNDVVDGPDVRVSEIPGAGFSDEVSKVEIEK